MIGIRILLLFVLIIVAQCKLYQLVSLFRHGARNHLNAYYDGNSTRQFWGELTAVGMRQHQNLGSMLRKEYIEKQKLLSNTYQREQIQIYTTNVNRTFQSVISQLYGLYPLGTGPKLPVVSAQYHLPPYSNTSDSDEHTFGLPLGHQPIPILLKDSVLMTDCARFSQEAQKNVNRQLQTYAEMNLTYYPFFKRMGAVFNISAASMNFSKISSLYDTLTVDRYLGRAFPPADVFTEDDYLNMRHLHYWYNYFEISFNLSRAINTGKFARILADFDDRIAHLQDKKLKWTFMSAHDTDLTAAILDLKIASAECVEQLWRKGSTSALNCEPGQQFASSLIFELHSDDAVDFYVKIRHEGKYVNLCEKESTSCAYQEWKDHIRDVLIDVDSVCGGKMTSSQARYETAYR